MNKTKLNSVEVLTIQNMKLQHQIKQMMKLTDYIDYVVCDGKQVAFDEMLSTKVDGLFQTDDFLQRAE